MKIQQIKIQNCLGIEDLEIRPGALTILSGANEAGKTSVLEAIKSVLSGGHDSSLIRQGTERAEVTITLDDGVELRKTVTPKRSTLDVIHPKLGKVSKSQTWINEIVNALSLDPISFLTAPPKQRLELLLEALPMRVAASDLKFLPVGIVKKLDLDRHALEVLGEIGKDLYDTRTGLNRAAKEKRATAGQLAETLPEMPPEGDWKTRLEALGQEFAALQEKAKAERHRIERDAKRGEEEIRKTIDQGIADSRAAFDKTCELLIADGNKATHSVYEREREAMEKARGEYQQAADPIQEAAGEARAMIEAQAKAESALEYIADLKAGAEKLEGESSGISEALKKLETLKSGLLDKLPIPGLEVRDGQIFVDGIPFDRCNDARKIRIAVELGRIRAGELGLLLVDHLEALDPEAWETFKAEAEAMGVQIVGARVSEGALTVSGEVAS